MTETTKNPLSALFRQPKIYMPLPSKGMYYPEGAVEIPSTGELPVYAMTARDELLFKTPDALMNGSATVDVIKSCVPNIKDPWVMPSIDLDAVLCAIRIATFGHEMEVTATCPECKHPNDFVVDLRLVLDNIRNSSFNSQIIVDDTIVIQLRPLNYDEITKASLKAFEHQRIFSIVNDDSISEEQKVKLFQESFSKLTDMTIDTVSQGIVSISTPAGSTDNKVFINEFLRNTDKKIFAEINKSIEKNRASTQMPAFDAECKECGHKFKMNLSLDQSDFFAKGF